MRDSHVLGLVLLLSWATSGALAADAQDKSDPACRLKSLGALDLEISSEGFALVPVTLNGTDAWMALNTASAFTMLTDATATAFDLKRRPINAKVELVSGGKPMTEQVSVALLQLGNISFRETLLPVSPQKESGIPRIELGRPVIGYLGINVFDSIDFELNLAGKKLVLFSQDHCLGKVVYWTTTYTEMPFTRDPLGTIVFPMELDGKKVEATFATGAAISSIDSNITKKVYGFDENSPGVTRQKTDDGSEEPRLKLMALTAPGLNISNTQMNLFRGSKSCGQTWRNTGNGKAAGYAECMGVLPLRLGMNVLTTLRIYVATQEKVIYASRADAK